MSLLNNQIRWNENQLKVLNKWRKNKKFKENEDKLFAYLNPKIDAQLLDSLIYNLLDSFDACQLADEILATRKEKIAC